MQDISKIMITFIIPTIGRATLQRTVDSLLKQNNPNWKAIIVFDGVPKIKYEDVRIESIIIPKRGKLNHAGGVRNFAIKQAKTEWIGFVDDDDTLGPDYIERFEEEIRLNPDAQCIIFRMTTVHDKSGVFPKPQDKNFIKNNVGISFVMKKKLNLLFEPSGTEDFTLLNKIREQGNKIVISPYVTYFVRELPKENKIYSRIIIN